MFDGIFVEMANGFLIFIDAISKLSLLHILVMINNGGSIRRKRIIFAFFSFCMMSCLD